MLVVQRAKGLDEQTYKDRVITAFSTGFEQIVLKTEEGVASLRLYIIRMCVGYDVDKQHRVTLILVPVDIGFVVEEKGVADDFHLAQVLCRHCGEAGHRADCHKNLLHHILSVLSWL